MYRWGSFMIDNFLHPLVSEDLDRIHDEFNACINCWKPTENDHTLSVIEGINDGVYGSIQNLNEYTKEIINDFC